MIIVKLISGLGNQLFQYALARQISLLKNVPLKLDLSFYNDQFLRSYKLDKYKIQAEVTNSDELNTFFRNIKGQDLFSKVYRKVNHYLPKYYKKYYKESEWWIYEPNIFRVTSNVYLEGYWQHYKYFENLHPSIFEELTIKENLDHGVKQTLSDLKTNKSSVSIHIRRGDYITDKNANDLMGVLPLSYYYQAVEEIKQRIKNPAFKIFSDDLNWVKDNLKISGEVQLMDIEGGNKDYIEIALMSSCAHHIIANSSFSWWGAFLNRHPDKIVIAPKNWVKQEEINKKIEVQFPSWIKL